MRCLLLATALGLALAIPGPGQPVASNAPATFGAAPVDVMLGEKEDEHGCLPSAGFIWCEDKKSCVRAWEGCDSIARECQAKCQASNAGPEPVCVMGFDKVYEHPCFAQCDGHWPPYGSVDKCAKGGQVQDGHM